MSLFKDGSELEKVQEALLDAFTVDTFTQMLRYKLDNTRLDRIVSPDKNFDVTIFRVLTEWAEPRDKTIQLIQAAHQANPSNESLLKVTQQYELGTDLFLDGNLQLQRESEKIFRQLNAFLDVGDWMQKIGEAGVQVCLIKGENGPIGTGFLVGPSVVLTNDHVAYDDAFQNNPESIVCQFDYKKFKGAILNSGKQCKLRTEGWLIAGSPEEARVKGSNTDNPGRDTLDYALLQLDEEIGRKSLINPSIKEEDSERGWFKLSSTSYDFKPGKPLIILQHPNGDESLKMAIETQAIEATSPSGVMVKYKTNTLGGSSGSPCFDLEWNLVALHHSGARSYNAGTPISLVVEDLKQKLSEPKMKEVLGLS